LGLGNYFLGILVLQGQLAVPVGIEVLMEMESTCLSGMLTKWFQPTGRGTRVDGLKCLGVGGAFDLVFLRVRGCRAPQTKGRRDAATHHGLPARKSFARENPRSGSGPSESARPEGEETVEGVRNPGDGTCRVRQTRVMRIPPPMSLKGQEPQEGQPDQAWSVRAFRPEP
jgi:hypothetical protein